jgi:hypothetical protein
LPSQPSFASEAADAVLSPDLDRQSQGGFYRFLGAVAAKAHRPLQQLVFKIVVLIVVLA